MQQPPDKSRKRFLKQSALLSLLPFVKISDQLPEPEIPVTEERFPIVISTWNHGIAANAEAWKVLSNGGTSLDAVESGVRISESDPEVTSVGYGGLPDQEGHVTLDACIMNAKGECGSVSYLEYIKNPISVARLVMEKTPHVMLSGNGALEFALKQGFKKEDLLTEKAKLRWEEWKKKNLSPSIDKNNHDTIGMLAIDQDRVIAGACTTSGLAWKLPGRVGDSPIIGAGLFVDGDVGAATATGRGEAVIKIAGTHLIVELMRNGKSPQQACEMAIDRIIQKQQDHANFQVGFLSVNLKGEIGAFAIHKGFQYAVYAEGENKLMDAGYRL